jgi:hypothetical protein
MFGNKKVKILWNIIAIIGVLAMLFFTVMPAFY